jgi:oligoendopeptidase F
VPPRLRPLAFELDKKQAALHERFPLDRRRYEVLRRGVLADVGLFRQENVPLLTELEKLSQKYQTITAAMTVEFDGQERTLPQMAQFQQVTDRAVRESAWRGVTARRLRDRDEIDTIYDDQLGLRGRVAANAGFPDFRDFSFKAMHRFDYTPRECREFHSAVEQHVVPLVRRLNDRRRRAMGLPSLRPWDLAVDEKGRQPLRPFQNGDDLLNRTRAVFRSMGAGLDEMFARLGDNGSPGESLDLDSRKGKAPGGYQYMRDRSRRPFIFMNAAGLHKDIETMVHEAGHAFHSMLCRDEPLVAYRESPTEFAEVASMSMELLTMPDWRAYYPNKQDEARAVREHLEGSITILAWIAQIDAFQHWVYTNPGHSRAQRDEQWLTLDRRFGPELDWAGLEAERSSQWQRQLHLFIHPFYYIEYGIAQLGAFGLWLTSLERGRDHALTLYKRALSLGGSRPLPELFTAAGLPFDFGDAAVSRIVRAVERELERLPE